MNRQRSILFVIVAAVALNACSKRDGLESFAELKGAGNVLVLGTNDAPKVKGATWIYANNDPQLQSALIAPTEKMLLDLMRERDVRGVWAVANARAAAQDAAGIFRGFNYVSGLVGRVLDRNSIYYTGDSFSSINPADAQFFVSLARGGLKGADMETSVYAKLFKLASDEEIAVSIEDGTQPLLWRSARADSLAKAISIAATSARQRAEERSNALGADFLQNIPSMTVRIQRYVHDGRLQSWDKDFINRAITSRHGIGIEREKDWRYRLPWQVARYPSAFDALQQMLHEENVKLDDVVEGRVRLYRFVVTDLVISQPSMPR